jgi:hypothetical protein
LTTSSIVAGGKVPTWNPISNPTVAKMRPSPGATKRPSLPGIVTSHEPSGCGSPIAGPPSGVERLLPLRGLVYVIVNERRWMTRRTRLPSWSV